MSDEDNYIERVQRNWKLDHGADISPDEMLRVFPLFGSERRAATLRSMDESMAGDITLGQARKHAQQLSLRRRFGEIHQAMLEVGK